MAVYVIAEAASTHDGDLRKAQDLVLAASEAGADAVKFQFWSSPAQMRLRRHVSRESAFTEGSIQREWFEPLADQASLLSLDFLCTAYLPEDIAVVAPYVNRFKIASFESEDDQFILAHKKYGKSVIISLGMRAGPMNMREALLALSKVQFLHCVSAYPTPNEEANIACVGWVDGYSDHTTSLISGALAVAYGATIVEKHFRLITTHFTSADYDHSLTPRALTKYIQNIRDAEVLIGDGIKRVMPSEACNVQYMVRDV